MPQFTDQIGHTITLDQAPRRIISIVPSQSEFLWDLGLREELIGITKFCIHPELMFKTKERVGGTKDLDIEKIRALKPDLIIGNKEENSEEQIKALQKEFPVWMSDIYSFADALDMMHGLGKITGKEEQAADIVNRIGQMLPSIKNIFKGERVAYFIWNKPYMGAGGQTFIHHVLEYTGFKNALADLDRYPELSADDLKKLDPDYCFLSSEPFPFKEKHVQELQQVLPSSRIRIVDGELFSWYGSRLLHLQSYIEQLSLELKP